jgi:formamidopyrimidine-DNA glycosylase
VPTEAMEKELCGHTVVGVERRAKYIQLFFDTGAMLVIHLGMTGNLGIFPRGRDWRRHDHVCWTLDDGMELRYHDVRRFGSLTVLPAEQAADREKTLFRTSGPEPLAPGFSGAYLRTRARGRDVQVKTFIMDSRTVVGIGNIYANESLFGAGIRPTRKVKRITAKEWNRLADEIRKVLRHAIECGGSTINDFIGASGERGYFQMHFRIYGRAGQGCSQCASPIKSMKITGRSSFFCAHCQK